MRESTLSSGDTWGAANPAGKPEAPAPLPEAGVAAGQTITLRMQPGYDHSYFFMASFIADHVAFHAKRLKA